MADTKDAELEITLETYDKNHVKVPKSIATRSAIINMMIEGEALPRRAAWWRSILPEASRALRACFPFLRFTPLTACLAE
jgi:hypothetical protein